MNQDADSPQRSTKATTMLGFLFLATVGIGVISLVGSAVSWLDHHPGTAPLYLIAAALGFGFALRSVSS